MCSLACFLHDLIANTLTTNNRKLFSSGWFQGTITKRSLEGLANDSEPLYFVEYEDGDSEELEAEQVLPLLMDPGKKDSLSKAISDLKKLLIERKKDPDERNEFLFSFHDRPDTFFGSSAQERERLCCSIHNYCIFSHTADECRCDEGVKVWQKATDRKPCIYRHDPECCKCDRIAMTVGQDESVFHAYILGS